MALAFALIIIFALIILIWFMVELKRGKHKLFAFILIVLILFLYISGSVVFSGRDINYKSVDGLQYASKLYMAWLKAAFSNAKVVTGNAVNMDWKSFNESEIKESNQR